MTGDVTTDFLVKEGKEKKAKKRISREEIRPRGRSRSILSMIRPSSVSEDNRVEAQSSTVT